ncbi:MAG: hypothetical protein KJO16_01375, partial [Muriicola sp.]|nr:hypothetical protein [Muriicola sp.]
MKRRILMTAMLMVLSAGLYSQIKIGDNPQNLDPSSVLELESSNRVFVITRITTAQMNAINPLPGAMIYNTDEQCLFYFEGTEWINLCDALRLTFTADPIFNDYSTIVITESEDNVNFEVREIRGQNIVDFTITSVDIQNNAITSSKLAPDSVGNEELQDNTVSDAEIDYAQVTLSDFTNDAGFITSVAIVSADAGNSIIPGSDNGAFLDLTPVQTALNDLDVAVTTISLVDNGDGTYDFTDSAGNVITILDTSVSTLVNLGDGTYTYTDETGATQVIDTNASSNPYDNTTSGLTATDVQAAIDEINALAGTVALVDNGDGTYDFTDAAGNTTIITDTSISTLVDNLDGTYTYTDETGATQVIDTNASSNPYDNTTSGLTATDVQAAIDEINALAGTVALVDNGDGTYDFTDAAGNTTIITDTSISTLVDNLDGTYTY